MVTSGISAAISEFQLLLERLQPVGGNTLPQFADIDMRTQKAAVKTDKGVLVHGKTDIRRHLPLPQDLVRLEQDLSRFCVAAPSKHFTPDELTATAIWTPQEHLEPFPMTTSWGEINVHEAHDPILTAIIY